MTSTTALRRTVLAATFVCAFVPVFLTAQAPKPIALEDYARFKRIGGASLSSDGKWMVYTVTPNEGDGTLFVQSLDTATKHEIPRGTGACSPTTRGTSRTSWRRATGRGGRGAGGRGGGRRRRHRHQAANARRSSPGRARVRSARSHERHQDVLPVSRELLVFAGRRLAADAPAGRGHDAGAGRRGRRTRRRRRRGATPAADTGPAGTDLLMRNLTTGAAALCRQRGPVLVR